MDSGFAFWLFAVSLGASALGGMLGMGGRDFHRAHPCDFRPRRHSRSDWRQPCVCNRMLVRWRGALSSEPPHKHPTRHHIGNCYHARRIERSILFGVIPVSYLFFLFAAILLVSVQQDDGPPRRSPRLFDGSRYPAMGRCAVLDSSYPEPALGTDIAYRVQRLPMGLMLMFGAGLISALLGIGSGVLKIPAMDTALRLPIKVSSATSNFMIGVTAAASAGAYFMRGDIVTAVAGPVALGSVVGALLGARILIRASNASIRLLFVVVLVALAAEMLLQAFGIGFSKGPL